MISDSVNTYSDLQAIARVLHNVLLDYPSETSIDCLAENRLGDTWPNLTHSKENQQGKVLLDRFLAKWNPEQINELKLDYGQLFFGPGEPTAMPWGSVYLGEEQLLNDKSTIALMAFYKQNGISFELAQNQPLDHIALFYAVLDQLLSQLVAEPSNKAVYETMVILIQQHMLPWSGRCLTLAVENAQTDFYKGIALLALDFQAALISEFNIIPVATRLFK
ncbi:molecular chaperone TorD family protein [Shewanella eurypsychrophilus]|uniref:Molecular chaperone TorD family protein n=1 Tax=Shewanella eurypsychrophilus TaxID=2593656 RepID=A0ABX6V118_9GAMM|nr:MULTISPECIES: molecular chaperone TorD family protein [Shewanella]QFU20641.1 molecular chaperone TorD [Shewanella sp. YLB-09]QFU20921.1 molecular chaperone TorD [Shewanella sp. YLB-09]QPG56209.1 molecular chaperone TorD family protein [Shewanella eurypsychrophilus]